MNFCPSQNLCNDVISSVSSFFIYCPHLEVIINQHKMVNYLLIAKLTINLWFNKKLTINKYCKD